MTMRIYEVTIVFEGDDGEQFGPPQVMVVGHDNAESFARLVAEYVFENDETIAYSDIAIKPVGETEVRE